VCALGKAIKYVGCNFIDSRFIDIINKYKWDTIEKEVIAQ
jgi:hypothetical protein